MPRGKPSKSVLFIEDHRELIKDLEEIIGADTDWEVDCADGILSAWNKLCSKVYELVVVDVMLVSWPGVPSNSEGIYLAKWIFGVDDGRDRSEPPPGTILELNRKAGIVFLTSRDAASTAGEVRKVIGKPVRVIGRLESDAQEQFDILHSLVK
jgi:hypothetical protein